MEIELSHTWPIPPAGGQIRALDLYDLGETAMQACKQTLPALPVKGHGTCSPTRLCCIRAIKCLTI